MLNPVAAQLEESQAAAKVGKDIYIGCANMKCNHCKSEWKTDEKISSSLSFCPFCKESLMKKDETGFFDNSKDALASIMNQFGADVLLGKLNAYLPDIAPSIPQKGKRLVYAVYENGAAQILKRNITASQADKEIAVNLAVRELTEAYIVPEMARAIIYEFTNALGWQVSVTEPTKPNHTQQHIPISNQSISVPAPILQSINVGEIIPFGGYYWRVLDVQNGKALLLSDKIIRKKRITVHMKITWEESELRSYLNGSFFDSFGKDRSRIAEVINRNANNQLYNTIGGNFTRDKIFLLSIDDAIKYFGYSGQLKGGEQNSGHWIDDRYNSLRIAYDHHGKACWWWLRSPGNSSSNAMSVSIDGAIRLAGGNVNTDSGGIRPALWLNL